MSKFLRKSIRLKGYDYSRPGYYFITIKTFENDHLFGEIINGKMLLNSFGEIVKNEWINSQKIRNEIDLDEYIIMPDHIHSIVIINPKQSVAANGRLPYYPPDNSPNQNIPEKNIQCNTINRNNDIYDKANGRSPLQLPLRNDDINCVPVRMKQKSISSFVAGFKSVVTKRINVERNMPKSPVWQRNYYEHIIRNEEELNKIRWYIIKNPEKWWQKNND